jgi:hypothetical protein
MISSLVGVAKSLMFLFEVMQGVKIWSCSEECVGLSKVKMCSK